MGDYSADNFKPPSISSSSAGLLHVENSKARDTNSTNPEWTLEFAGSGSSAHSFSGHQTAAKDIDCVLVWDDEAQAYVLDRLASSFSLKYERGHSSLTAIASRTLAERGQDSPQFLKEHSGQENSPQLRKRSQNRPSLRDEEASEKISPLQSKASREQYIDESDEEEAKDKKGIALEPNTVQDPTINDEEMEEDIDDEELARQIEMSFDAHAQEQEQEESMKTLDAVSTTAGLGLISERDGSSLLGQSVAIATQPPSSSGRESIPRRMAAQSSKEEKRSTQRPSAVSSTAMKVVKPPISAAILGSPAMGAQRHTPAVSPRSALNSPRVAAEPLSGANTNWKPPTQRSPVKYSVDDLYEDEDEEEEDEDEDDDEDDDDDDGEEDEDDGARKLAAAAANEEEMDEGDLEDFARQLDNSFSAPVSKATQNSAAANGAAKGKGRSSRTKK